MPCARCEGLMVRDQFYDLLDDSGHLSITAWRCVSCGNIVDPLILKNRLRFEASPLVGKEPSPLDSVLTVASVLKPSS